MSLFYVKTLIPCALVFLPKPMDTPEARAMLLAICLQESRCESRRQIGGPARGFPQFELGISKNAGIRGVLNHLATRPIIEPILRDMQYGLTAEISYAAIEHNDILALIYARLLLWTSHQALPDRDHPNDGWALYMNTWVPGQPRRATWNGYYEQAWS